MRHAGLLILHAATRYRISDGGSVACPDYDRSDLGYEPGFTVVSALVNSEVYLIDLSPDGSLTRATFLALTEPRVKTMMDGPSTRRSDGQLECMLCETAGWTVKGVQGAVLCETASLP